MGRFAVRRIAQGFLVIFGVTIMVFVFTRMVGDPVKVMLPLEASRQERAAFEHQLGLDRSIPAQFVSYVGDLARGDLGTSLWQRRPAIDIVLEALPRTFELVLAAIALAVLLAIPLGVLAALRPGRALDRVAVVLSLAGLSIPQFWLALLLIVVFAVRLKLFPTAGMGGPEHLVLPMLALAFPALGRIAMIMRSSMIDELNQQYVKTADAKGLPRRRIVGVHALRNASIPALTLTGWELIRALAGYSVVVETVFAWPGIGLLANQALDQQDLILLQAIVFVVALLVVLINIAVDILYKAVDPRIKLV
ncbi:MAG TPA: ABC transporter permease [Actinomycetes bacterium]|nr:ABC transporter permease [Actinomycetes bacterium]